MADDAALHRARFLAEYHGNCRMTSAAKLLTKLVPGSAKLLR
jgi:hypothetical protein